MTTTQRCSLLPLIALVGVIACAPDSEGLPAGTDGTSPATGGTSPATGGTSATGGGTSTGGSPTGTGGTSLGSGGAPAAGGTPGTGGSVGNGGSAGPDGGSVDAAGSVGPAPAGDKVPAGYPVATTDNLAKCKTVAMTSGLCPGGGTGPICMQCLFGGTTYGTAEMPPPTAEGTMLAGNYVVTVKLGGAAAGQTYIGAESSRGLLQSVSTTAGQSLDYAFVVNVRAMEGQPNHAGGPQGYPGLDLFFSGTAPQVSAIGYALATPATKPVMVYMAGDSTVCDQTGNAFAGWGQMLPQYFAPPVGIANYANSGASSGGFGFWNDIKARWTAGDWVIIQFGHNDKAPVTDAQVQANLERYVTDALAANVTPILVSPPARVQFSGSMEGSQTSLHAASAKAAAAAKNVAYIDLTSLSTAWYNTLGSQAAALKFHANGSDPTHTNIAGADKLAALVIAEMKAQNLGLAKYLRP